MSAQLRMEATANKPSPTHKWIQFYTHWAKFGVVGTYFYPQHILWGLTHLARCHKITLHHIQRYLQGLITTAMDDMHSFKDFSWTILSSQSEPKEGTISTTRLAPVYTNLWEKLSAAFVTVIRLGLTLKILDLQTENNITSEGKPIFQTLKWKASVLWKDNPFKKCP